MVAKVQREAEPGQDVDHVGDPREVALDTDGGFQ
jgi:hypothetical protein